jgi:nucleoside-diphosphate-sugar epimerase
MIQAKSVGVKVTIFLPALILGPPPTLEPLNLSVSAVYNFFNGTFHELPDTYSAGLFPTYIDVRDLATAHVRALTSAGAANKRFLIGCAKLTSCQILDTLEGLAKKNIVPELKGRLPKDTGKDTKTHLSVPRFNVNEGNEILGLAIRSTEETLGDLAKKIVELEKK